ncbi:LOW QUALITY PROTEIN: P-element somatic inhibitor [Aphomia sociella]
MSDYPSMATLQNNSQTAGYANALQRARLVAAKLVGGSKRPLEEGSEPSPKKSASVDSGYQQQTMSATAAATAAAAAAAARISASCGPGAPPAAPPSPPNFMPEQTIDERIRVPDKMVGLIIGRGGEQITRLQAESGCKIQMAPDSGGQPDRICTLTGSREAIQRAKDLVNQIVNHRGRENAPQHQDNPGGGGGMPPMPRPGGLATTEEIMLPGPKVGLIIGKNGKTIKQLQEQSGAKMVVIQEGPNTEYEKPLRISGDPSKVEHAKQLVYELLADKDMQGGGGSIGGSVGGGSQRPQYDDVYSPQEQGNGLATNSTEVPVPKIAVGVVIGRGGDMIKRIQAETGCRVQFHQERDDGPGDKRCYLQGKPHQVEQARQMIEDLISSVNRRDQEERSSGRGRGGSGQRNGDRGDYQQWQDNQEIRVTFTVSNVKCGLIIGRGGEVIKQMNAQTGAHCEVDRRAPTADRNTRTFYIRGHPDAVEQCKRLVMEKVGMPINFIQEGGNNGGGGGAGGGGGGGGGGVYYGGGGGMGGGEPPWSYNPHWHQPNAAQQPQINPSTGQPDYSQQWIDYYRSLGLMREAEAIEQQARQQQGKRSGSGRRRAGARTPGGAGAGGAAGAGPGPAAPGPAQGAAAGAGGDYSAQWAEYYRNIGKIKEAEAIEAQIKLKQQSQGSGAIPQPPQPPQQGTPTPAAAPAAGGPGNNGPMGGQYPPQYPMYPGAMYSGYAPYPYSAASAPDHQQQ